MSERKINLEEIIASKYGCVDIDDLQLEITLNPDLDIIKSSMLEFGKQLLELAAENAELTFVGESDSDGMDIDKQSILDTIKQVE